MATYLITGANRGIGLEMCRQLAGEHVIFATCRKASPELQALGVNIISDIDITNENSLERLQGELAGQHIDVLINNAGVWGDEKFGALDAGKMASVISINAIAPILVTEALSDNLADGSKVVMITSRMGSIADNGSGGRYSYRMSKAALNAASKSLSIDLHDRGIAVGIIHPGWVATDMGGPQGIPVAESAANIINRVNELTLENSGEFKHANGESLPW